MKMIQNKISVLVSARKNSKYLAKFLFGYFANTHNRTYTEILVMLNAEDTWNKELRWFFEEQGVRFFEESYKLGRAGLHVYLNDLLQHATGDWIIYFCEDHFITRDGWDLYLRQFIYERSLSPDVAVCIVPKFDNCGAMNHMLSRGYIGALGGYLGRHGWIDSYINDVNRLALGDTSERLHRVDDEIFHDFTHDHPNPMDDAHMQSITSQKGKQLPKHGSDEYKKLVSEDAEKLRQAIERSQL